MQKSWDDTLKYCSLIMKAASNTGLEPVLLASLILHESAGQEDSMSHQGAVGLMQVMPRDGLSASFMCPNGPCFSDRPTISELSDPAFNIEYGSSYLAGLVNKYGLREGLFHYGPSGVGFSYADYIISVAEMIKNQQ